MHLDKNKNGQPFIVKEIEWLRKVIEARFTTYFGAESALESIYDVELVDAAHYNSHYANFVNLNKLTFDDRVVLILALVPHVQPDFFDTLFTNLLNGQGDFPQIGGLRGKNFRGFLPTVETALFILAGTDLEKRFEHQAIFDIDHIFHKKQVLYLSDNVDHEPVTSSKLILEQDYIDLLTLGKITKPKLSTSFPAQLISTEMVWDDLVLNTNTLQQIKEIEYWIKYNDTLLNEWNMKTKIKPGYRCMFHGPPGTGKTLTANLLGKYTGRDVFRIDLSTVISKYIGETEKNLSVLFDKAQSKDWILFFDEADALFGKRTNVRDAHDKYANQEVSYLLQRIENHSGLIILASNFKSNIDEAFTRRFHSMIFFPMPNAAERLMIWEKSLPEQLALDRTVDLPQIAKNYELTGANIVNVVQFVCLQALARNSQSITRNDIAEGIKKEFTKEGKLFQG